MPDSLERRRLYRQRRKAKLTPEQKAKITQEKVAWSRNQYRTNPAFREKCKLRAKRNNAIFGAERNERRKERYKILVETCISAYGGICACCRESNRLFLSIDHINNDGNVHRKTLRTKMLYRWLIKNSFPAGFQILCFNCNLGKHRNGGYCPHKDTYEMREVPNRDRGWNVAVVPREDDRSWEPCPEVNCISV